MIPSSSCPPWQQLDRPGPAGDHDGLAVVTPLHGTRSEPGCGTKPLEEVGRKEDPRCEDPNSPCFEPAVTGVDALSAWWPPSLYFG